MQGVDSTKERDANCKDIFVNFKFWLLVDV